MKNLTNQNKQEGKMITCYQRVGGNGWTQEMYETASRDAGKRARELRKAGYRVTVSGLGSQVTNVGRVNMTMVDIRGETTPPMPERLVRL